LLVHLGKDVAVSMESIIMILDSKISKYLAVQDFLENIKEEGFLHELTVPGKERSYIISDRGVFISSISSTTLKKRAGCF